jgi:hypothetical protein
MAVNRRMAQFIVTTKKWYGDRRRNLKSLAPSLTLPNVVAGNLRWYLDTDPKCDVAYKTLRALAGPMPQA